MLTPGTTLAARGRVKDTRVDSSLWKCSVSADLLAPYMPDRANILPVGCVPACRADLNQEVMRADTRSIVADLRQQFEVAIQPVAVIEVSMLE